jgi:hypothetical protein
MFDVEKFVTYLNKHKNDLHTLYKWNAKIDRLIELDTLTENQVSEFDALSAYEKELKIKKIVGEKLNDTLNTNRDLFNELCLWVIKDWGGISTASDKDTIILINDFLFHKSPNFNRIASYSKVRAFMFPETNIIYDSRVAYSINWIILSENAGIHYFPIPVGRNSKMSAFDLNVLIRLKNISVYQATDIKCLDHSSFIKKADKNLFINKKVAYSELNKLIKQISEKLWEDDMEKARNLYFTEMLLFSIADREIYMDITKNYTRLILPQKFEP